MALPPHLPPPTCDIDKHRQWQRIKILLAATVFGLAAGLSGASMMIGWIWPGLGGGDTWVVSQRLSAVSRTQLEERVVAEADDRVARVYGATEINRGVQLLSQKNLLGTAVMLSSDGWLALYALGVLPNYRNWQVVLRDGAVHEVDKILPDKLTGLVFFHIIPRPGEVGASAQFKVAGLADVVPVNSDLYILNGDNWQWSVAVAQANSFDSYPHLDSAPVGRVILNSDFFVGQPVLNNQGRLAGFVVGKRELLPFQYVARLLPGVLNNQKIIYPTWSAEGWYSSEQPFAVDGAAVKGFYVSKSTGVLRAGDIVLEVNGRLADNDEMWYNVKAGETMKLTVWRGGKKVEMETKILEKKF